ncbi:MAG: hypothetical protein ACT4N5_06240 [Nitrosopumilaceae archaeon]
MIEGFTFLLESITLVLLFVATGIFSWITVKTRNVRSFQFQTSIFVLIWLIGVMVNLFQENQMTHSDLGMQIHLVAMAFLSCMLWLRFYHSKKKGKKLIEGLDSNDN